MESYELNRALNENDDVVLKSAVGEVRFEKMQEQWELYALDGAILIVFDAVFCESAKNIELYLCGKCVASFDPSIFEVA